MPNEPTGTPTKRADLDFTDKENLIIMEDYLRVEDVRVNPNQGGFPTVEVRAATEPDGPTHWKSLRYHCLPERAPRANDVVRIIVIEIPQSSAVPLPS